MTDAPTIAHPYEVEPEIRTERLLLRPLALDDLDVFFDYRSREDVVRYAMMPVQTREQSAASLAKWMVQTRLVNEGDMIVLAVERIEKPGLIGEMSIRIKSVPNQTAELGWILHPHFHGHGYATESAKALLPICFERMRLHRVMAEIDPCNGPSDRVCQRLGMRKEAHFLEDVWERGEWAGTVIYGMLEREWHSLG